MAVAAGRGVFMLAAMSSAGTHAACCLIRQMIRHNAQFLRLALLLGAVLSAGGCGGGGGREGGSGADRLPPVEDAPVTVEEAGEADPDADPAARRGGTITTWGGPFPASLNYWLDANSLSGTVCGLMFESLAGLHPAEDRAEGGLARSWTVSDDGMTFTFEIHPAAAWSDGRPVEAEDFVFYYDTIMDPKNPTSSFRVGLSRLERPEALGPKTLRVRAKQRHWSVFWDAAGLTAFPRHRMAGREFTSFNFEFPAVSGPYELKQVLNGRSVLLKRRGDWWGRSLRRNLHKYNFDYIRFRFMEDRFKSLEALKKGDFDLYAVYTAAIWAEQTRFPAVEKGWVARQEIYNDEPKGFQGFAMNLRRPLFQDRRVREALARLLNREQMLDKLMYNQYFLLNSYYPDLFEGNRNPEAPEVVYDPERARALLAEAGWVVNAAGRLEKDGEPFRLSFLYSGDPLPHLNIYMQDLQRVGIDASVETVSQSTFSKRLDEHKFDMAWIAWGAGRLRDPETLWSSKTADEPSTFNIPGFRNAEVDALIEAQKTEFDLAKRNEILRRIDTILTREMPYVLLWQSDRSRLLYWNRFGTPKSVLGRFGRETAALVYWWADAEKAAALDAARASGAALPALPEKVFYGR